MTIKKAITQLTNMGNLLRMNTVILIPGAAASEPQDWLN
jgi:hypothetical protein